MAVWTATLEVADLFRAYEDAEESHEAFFAVRDGLAERIRAASFYDEEDYELVDLVEELGDVGDASWFDDVFGRIYDWADDHRIWIETAS